MRHRNLHTMAYEIFKIKAYIAPEIFTEIFPLKKSNNNLRNNTTLQGRSIAEVEIILYGSETMSSLQPKIWDIFPKRNEKTLCFCIIQKENW